MAGNGAMGFSGKLTWVPVFETASEGQGLPLPH
jgi:hypothetical protein